MGYTNPRIQALTDERDTLEKARLAIASGLPIPSIAQQYVTAQAGQSGERMHGDELRMWFDTRLKEIDRQLRLFPVAMFRRMATVVQVTGKDLSQFSDRRCHRGDDDD